MGYTYNICNEKYVFTYLQLITSINEVLRYSRQSIVAQIQNSQIFEVFKLVGAENGVEVVTEHVVTKIDLLQRVLHPVKQPLCQSPHGVVGEVHNLERNITGSEDLSW